MKVESIRNTRKSVNSELLCSQQNYIDHLELILNDDDEHPP